MNTMEHELGHHFLGHVGTVPKDWGDRVYHDLLVDGTLEIQGWGSTQYDFRQGLAQKNYAVPVDPQAIKPKK